MPLRPTDLSRRYIGTTTRLLRQAPRSTSKPTAAAQKTSVGKATGKRIGYVVPVKAFSQETQAFLKDEEGLALGEVLKEGLEEGQGAVGRGSVVEMRR